MADITVIGLGPLGAALARTLVESGHDTVVWNRSASRVAPLVAAGARAAASPAEAVAASPIVVVCVQDYAASDAILRTPEVEKALDGRVLVQLFTGSPRQAREADAWVTACGAAFLAGHVQAYPREIGRPDTSILLSGSEAGFARCEAPLRILAPALAYLGTDPAGGLIMSLAVTLTQFAARAGVMYGLAITEGSGLSREQYAELIGPYLKRGVDTSLRDAFALDDPAFKETQAPIRIWKAGFPSIAEIVTEADCDPALVRCFEGLLDSAIALGWEGINVAALSKSLGGKAGPGR